MKRTLLHHKVFYSFLKGFILFISFSGRISPAFSQVFCNAYGDLTATSTANDIKKCPTGGYIIAGSTGGLGSIGGDALLIRISEAGNILWQKTYGGKNAQTGNKVVALPYGFLLGGTTLSDSTGLFNVFITKTDTLGNVQWTKTIHHKNYWDILGGLAVFDDGGFAVGSTIYGTSEDILIRRYDINQTLQWTDTISSPESERIKDLQVNNWGKLIVAGEIEKASTDIFLAAYSEKGDSLFFTISGTEKDELIGGLALHPNNKMVVSATTKNSQGIGQYFLLRFDSLGKEELAIKEFPENQNDKKIGPVVWDGSDKYVVLSTGITGFYKLIGFFHFDENLDFKCFGFIKGQFASMPNAMVVDSNKTCIIAGETEISPPSLPKIFSIKFNQFNCPFDSAICNNLDLKVSIEKPEGENFSVFPNPSSGALHLSIPKIYSDNSIKIDLIDLNGRIYYPTILKEDNYWDIDLSRMTPSVYLIRIYKKRGGEMIALKRIIIQP